METVETQGVETPTTEKTVETKVETPATENNGGNGSAENNAPYKTFASKEDFDRHSAGILNSAKNKAEKELLAMLGLKPDEKDKLAKFKEAYDNTLSESEKQAKNLENLNNEVNSLKSQIAEKDAIIVALSKLTGKNSTDVDKYVRMAKGLVDENTTIESALEQVLSYMKKDEKPSMPSSKPLTESSSDKKDENPFETGNLTKQGDLIKSDREKARAMYMAIHGRAPSW
jgi:chromosome segregation ATPase